MNTLPTVESPRLDVTVRIGCSLIYEVSGAATLLLNLRPCRNRNHAIVFEAISIGNDLQSEEFDDSHGNRVTRVQLAPGTNCVRHDAIVRASSNPDNHDLVNRTPYDSDDLPPVLLRYVLPSRYVDSDRLTDFAWQKFGTVEHGWPRMHAISQWVHENIEYRYQSGRTVQSAATPRRHLRTPRAPFGEPSRF